MRILGIDPGTNLLGFAIIDCNIKPQLVNSGTINISKTKDHYTKLSHILSFVIETINNFKPDVLSIESQFYAKNIQVMFKLGRIQGVCIAAAISSNVSVVEYSPREIKLSMTGNGNASKEQVAKMLNYILSINYTFEKFDETDAIAIALTHYFKSKSIVNESKYVGWSDYINKNANKIK